jgi:hypothetical protein
MKPYRFNILLATLVVVAVTVLTAPGAHADLIDDFADGNLNGWTPLGGDWVAEEGVAKQSTVSGYYQSPPQILRLDSPVNNDFSLQADVFTPSGARDGDDAVGLAFRIQDANNYYSVHFFPDCWPGGALRFTRWQDGLFSNLTGGSGDIDMGFLPLQGQFYTLRLDAVGSDFTVSVWNGTNTSNPADYIKTFTDSTFTSGSVGLWNQEGPGSFDNVQGTGVQAVPEASTSALLATGLGVLALFLRRKKQALPQDR